MLTPVQAQLQQFQQQPDELHALHCSGHPQQFSTTARLKAPEDQVHRNSVSLDSLYSATIKNAQYRASDFSKLGNFSYSPQIKQNNMNLALFSYGSLKHLLALSDGTLPLASKEEFNARLRHVINVLEISCLGSNLSDFDSQGWKVGREYDSKVIQDIELGLRKWETLGKTICPTSWTYAKELVSKQKPAPTQTKQNNNSSANLKLCTTWNSFRKPGCSYEHNNPGEQCVYLHICSRCKTTKGVNLKHKLWKCTENDQNNRAANTSGAVTVLATSA